MGKRKSNRERAVLSKATVFCGIDVSAATLAVAVEKQRGMAEHQFANTAAGHKQLLAWLAKNDGVVRVTLEATGIYSFNLALALDGAEGIEVMVLNPKRAKEFTKSRHRSKTDKTDARSLAEYSRRMEFVPWRRPAESMLQLRSLGRHLVTLTGEHTRLRNRLHAATVTDHTPSCVLQDLKRSMATLQKRIARLRCQAKALIEADPDSKSKFHHMISIPGIGETSAIQIMAELAILDPEMNVRQWVAHSGLDPAHHESGSSVRKPSHISREGNRYLRQALYMPALVACQHDPHFKAFYLALQQRHKAKLQAIIAVARKMLHAIFGVFKSRSVYDGHKLFPDLLPSS